jgi:hypothetical protein
MKDPRSSGCFRPHSPNARAGGNILVAVRAKKGNFCGFTPALISLVYTQ